MRALVVASGQVGVRSVPAPAPGPHHVVVQVCVAGVCRTDVQVAQGLLAAADPVVLGHELAGRVERIGPGVPASWLGSHVSAIPWHGGHRLGVEVDGAFAERVCLHQDQLVRVSDDLPWRVAAYVEPVAAALGAVLPEPVEGPVCVLGSGRIAALTARVLRLHGADVTVTQDPGASRFGCVVEARPTPDMLRVALDAVRPGGLVVLKSRANVDVPLPLGLAVSKRVTLRAVGHGDFGRAAALLASGALDVADLLGPTLALEDWRRAFAAGESTKVFLAP